MKILAKIMFYPRLMFRVVNWKRIKNGWKYFRLEGIGGDMEHLWCFHKWIAGRHKYS
mgnify:CR=1 FL=1